MMAYERAEILAGAAILALAAGFALYAVQGRGVVGEARVLASAPMCGWPGSRSVR
jgi:hypothetical protein